MRRRIQHTCLLCLELLVLGMSTRAAGQDEFRVKREAVFEFAKKPVVVREGDRVAIAFETTGYCDVTVAVEDPAGRIVRHLACGVLGENAPPPFRKASKEQIIVWDGKDDQERYIDDKDNHSVRISLGLMPRFERTLFWSPQKRWSKLDMEMKAAPEGVYVFENALGVAQLRLFDHEGNYARTLYPFPSDKIGKVTGLHWKAFPQDGKNLPVKRGFIQATLLSSGDSVGLHPDGFGIADRGEVRGPSLSVKAMAVLGDRISLANVRLNRMSRDGTTGPWALDGPKTGISVAGLSNGGMIDTGPRSIAFSPDGKTLYLTGYTWFRNGRKGDQQWKHAVYSMGFEDDGTLKVFKGTPDQNIQGGNNETFCVPSSVACDAKGRVYVTDFMNHRIQVFAADGSFVKSIKSKFPAHLEIDLKTGELYVFSWMLVNMFIKSPNLKIEATLTRLKSVDDPKVVASYPLPLTGYNPSISWNSTGGLEMRVALDPYADKPRIWLVPGAGACISAGNGSEIERWTTTGIKLLEVRNGNLEVTREFGKDAAADVVRTVPPPLFRQRLYVNPTNGRLYVGEGQCGVHKSFKDLLEIDPETGKAREVPLPFDAEDMCFDTQGMAYLRTDTVVARYDARTWREVPWDYGIEMTKVAFDGGSAGRSAPVISGLELPSHRPWCFHLGGMNVSVDGSLVVTCWNTEKQPERKETRMVIGQEGRKYTPRLYPGRIRGHDIHIWDKHGQLISEDAVPGLGDLYGIGIDKNKDLYFMASPPRFIDGKPYFNDMTGTLVKASPGKTKVISSRANVAVPVDGGHPDRPPDVQGCKIGTGWIEGAHWFYGGVGFGGFNSSRSGGGCACWNARFDLDLFARSFAPELDRYSVSVLDSNGNLILRTGTYGNVDDGKPLVPDGGPASPHAIGGDEVALFHGAYIAAHTDKRLFIADPGNHRILSVKLAYHVSERISLVNASDGATKKQ